MAAFAVGLLLLFAMSGHSDAVYCLCNTGLSESQLQTNIDYACAHADCSGILQNGACYNPNMVRDHCNYAVNSYYQRYGQASGSCNFSATATVTSTPPSNISPGCVYLSSPSNSSVLNPPAGTGGTTSSPSGIGGNGSGLFPRSSPPALLGPSSSTSNNSGLRMSWELHVFMIIVTSCLAKSGWGWNTI